MNGKLLLLFRIIIFLIIIQFELCLWDGNNMHNDWMTILVMVLGVVLAIWGAGSVTKKYM
jgi:hypothetical protein